MMKIVCIIPSACTNKTLPYIKRCIRSLRTAANAHVALIILVVSANGEARKLLLQSQIDNFCLVDPSLGFAQMNNAAIEGSISLYQSDYYLLINDDAYVRNDFFSVLQARTSRRTADIICPLIYKPNKTIDSFGIEYFRSGFAKNAQCLDIPTTLAAASCVLIRMAFLKKMNRRYGYYFNPLLRSYYEDTEFSLRALMIGGSIIKTPLLVAHHVGSLSYGKNSVSVMFYSFRNILWVMYLTWPTQFILHQLPAIIVVQCWFFLLSLRAGGWWIYPKILMDTIHNFGSLSQYRHKILSAYTSTFSQVFSSYWFRTNRLGKTLGITFPKKRHK